MDSYKPIELSNFFVAGVNYKKTDAATRGKFSINEVQYENILNLAPNFNVDSLFVLSTCNRTEIYGFAETPSQLIDLLCSQTQGSKEVFNELAYIKNSDYAVAHLFNVAAGLDSQILGDYEITGQLKQAFKFAKDHDYVNCVMERLYNNVLQSSKIVKNDTALSGGTVSVSFAAIQYIKENVTAIADKKILIVGAGKIGRNTCKNLVDYLGARDITVMNRSEEKASGLSSELNLKHAPITELDSYLALSDIILVATNAQQAIVSASQLLNKGKKLIIDLSVPNNVEPAVNDLQNITLVDVDELSHITDKTLKQRELEVPKAKEIIKFHIALFKEWHQMRKTAPTLKAIKTKLHEINTGEHRSHCPVVNAADKIQKVVNNVADKMRTHNQGGCHYLEAINEFMTPNA
jgi:glutamyl-tRNA reductase